MKVLCVLCKLTVWLCIDRSIHQERLLRCQMEKESLHQWSSMNLWVFRSGCCSFLCVCYLLFIKHYYVFSSGPCSWMKSWVGLWRLLGWCRTKEQLWPFHILRIERTKSLLVLMIIFILSVMFVSLHALGCKPFSFVLQIWSCTAKAWKFSMISPSITHLRCHWVVKLHIFLLQFLYYWIFTVFVKHVEVVLFLLLEIKP